LRSEPNDINYALARKLCARMSSTGEVPRPTMGEKRRSLAARPPATGHAATLRARALGFSCVRASPLCVRLADFVIDALEAVGIVLPPSRKKSGKCKSRGLASLIVLAPPSLTSLILLNCSRDLDALLKPKSAGESSEPHHDTLVVAKAFVEQFAFTEIQQAAGGADVLVGESADASLKVC
jgi:hypothetical protein